MSLILRAPYPHLTTTTLLPSPEFSDSEAARQTMQASQAMDGTLYTYVKSNARSKLQYALTLSRAKALELRAFVLSYYRATVLLTNHKGETWNVKFTSNPFEFEGVERAQGTPGGETVK